VVPSRVDAAVESLDWWLPPMGILTGCDPMSTCLLLSTNARAFEITAAGECNAAPAGLPMTLCPFRPAPASPLHDCSRKLGTEVVIGRAPAGRG